MKKLETVLPASTHPHRFSLDRQEKDWEGGIDDYTIKKSS